MSQSLSLTRKQYAAIYDRQYLPQLRSRIGIADIPAVTTMAAEDIEIVRTRKPGTVKDDSKRSRNEKSFRK
jgi:hypothetical protein